MDRKGPMFWKSGETAVALDSAADEVATWIVPMNINITEIGILVTVAGTSGTLVAGFDRRILPGDDTDRIDHGVGVITCDYDAVAVGQIIKQRVSASLQKGDELVFQVETAWGTTGDGIPYVLYEPAGEATVEYDLNDEACSVASE